MKETETDWLRLIEAIYEAATSPERWPAFLEDFAQVCHADIAIVQRHHLTERRSEVLAGFGISNRFTASYNAHYSKINVWRNRGQHNYVAGRAIMDPQQCPRSILEKTEFYNDYLVPMGGVHSLTGVVAREGDDVLALTALRSPRGPIWHKADQAALEILLPHVARACLVQQHLQLAEAGTTTLDTLSIGVVFLTASRRCVHMNRSAEAILTTGDGLFMRDDVLCAREPDAENRLRAVIQDAVAAGATIECRWGASIPRASARRSYQVVAVPFRRATQLFMGARTPSVMLLITDPDRTRPAAPELLRQMYGLTSREAALAAELSTGQTVEQAAESLGIRYETARTHLRRIFDKTHTSRQTDLVLLLGRLPRATAAP